MTEKEMQLKFKSEAKKSKIDEVINGANTILERRKMLGQEKFDLKIKKVSMKTDHD